MDIAADDQHKTLKWMAKCYPLFIYNNILQMRNIQLANETKDSGKEQIRQDILNASECFCNDLVGKYFLYVFNNRYIEVLFRKDSFSHLTGVETYLSGNDFYKKAKRKQLGLNQFYFNKIHPFDLAKKKSAELYRLKEFTDSDIFILEEVTTASVTYKFGFTNFDCSLCLSENVDTSTGVKINDLYIPMSFRIKDKIFDNSKSVYEVDFIFMKENTYKEYNILMFGDINKINSLPCDIINLIELNNRDMEYLDETASTKE